jgi:hypothetical protein
MKREDLKVGGRAYGCWRLEGQRSEDGGRREG